MSCQHTDMDGCPTCQHEAEQLHVYLDEQGIGDGTGTLLERVVQLENEMRAELRRAIENRQPYKGRSAP